MHRRDKVGNPEGSDSDSRIRGHDSNRPSPKPVGGTTHNSGAHSVQDTRQESKSRLKQVDRQIRPLRHESIAPATSAAETKRQVHTLSFSLVDGMKNFFGYNTSASQNHQLSMGQHSSDSLTNQLMQAHSDLADTQRLLRQKQASQADLEMAHEDRERSMQIHIDNLSADLETVRISSQKYEANAARYRQERNTLQDAQSLAQHQSQAAMAAQETSRPHHTPRGSEGELANVTRELRIMKSNEAALDARLNSLMQEREEAQVTIKRLRDAQDVQASSQGTFSLDSFRDVVDQVSEAHVSFTGHPSVERLNEAIDNMVLEALEQASEALAAQGDPAAHFAVKPPPLDTPLFASLAKRSLTEENRGFLLDACLHSLVVHFVYDMFFQSTISTIAVDDEVEVLDKVFSKIAAAEPWAVCQRWRAITASATASMFEPAELEGQAHHIEKQVFRSIAWAYGQPPTTFHPIRAKLLLNITAVMHDAHELSLVLKRDILSVRVMAALRHRDGPYDPQFEDSVWPEMGAKAGDRVIGVYGLGLQKVTPAGQNVAVVKPKVITSALLREIESEKGR